MKTNTPTPEQTLKRINDLLDAPVEQITATVRIQLMAAQGRLNRMIAKNKDQS